MSNSSEISVTKRQEFGSGVCRRARKNGMVPACIYSKGQETRALYVNNDEWKVLSGKHSSNLITLIEDGKKISALVKDIQYNHLKGYVQHIDFLEVSMDEEVNSKVQLVALGDCIGAARGGILEQDMYEIDVKCKPANLPESIQVDISNLNVGETIHVKDLVLPEGITAIVDGEIAVFHVVRAKASVSEGAASAE